MTKFHTRIIEPEHDENYDSDDNKKSLGDRRLSRVEDKKLRHALSIVRSSSDRELKEECLRNEWYTITNEGERDVLKDCVNDERFWEEVKELARREIESTPEVMGDDQFRKMFKEFDADNSGSIDAAELRKLLSVAMGMDCTEAEVEALLSTIDADGNREIDESEFLEIMRAAKRQQENSAVEYAAKGAENANKRARGLSLVTRRPPILTTHGQVTSPNHASPHYSLSNHASPLPTTLHHHGLNQEVSQPLVRKASLIGDKNERAHLLGRATAIEYKDMLMQKAANANASPSSQPALSPTEEDRERPRVEFKPKAGLSLGTGVGSRAPPSREASPIGAMSSTPGQSSLSPRRSSESGSASAPLFARASSEPMKSHSPTPLTDESYSIEPPRRVSNKPRGYSGKNSVPAYMRSTASSKKKH
ncbi:Calmodulin [Diplonema papillatum]|nr:Calmodulin [Diplonema papillatum]